MNNTEIRNKVIKEIVSYKKLDSEVGLLEKNFDELDINSLEFISLIVKCESDFGVTFEDERLLMDSYANMDAFISYAISLCNSLEKNG